MLIVLEGTDGNLLKALAEAISQRLRDAGADTEVTSELGRSEDWSIDAREQLSKARNQMEQLHVINKVREIHAERILQPLLANGTTVIMCRYLMATLAYQSCQSIPAGWLIQRHLQSGLPVPDMQFLVNTLPAITEQRKRMRAGSDSEDLPVTLCEPCFRDEVASQRYAEHYHLLNKLDMQVGTANGNAPLSTIIENVLVALSTIEAAA